MDGGAERVDLEERRSFVTRRKLGMPMSMLDYGWRYGSKMIIELGNGAMEGGCFGVEGAPAWRVLRRGLRWILGLLEDNGAAGEYVTTSSSHLPSLLFLGTTHVKTLQLSNSVVASKTCEKRTTLD